MTKQEQRAAIAKVMGWTEIFGRFQHLGLRPGDKDDGTENCLRVLPDYLNDLNAMHEAEKVLSKLEQDQYWDHLKDMTCEGFDQLHSNSRQRAEAFLKTLNLWKE